MGAYRAIQVRMSSVNGLEDVDDVNPLWPTATGSEILPDLGPGGSAHDGEDIPMEAVDTSGLLM